MVNLLSLLFELLCLFGVYCMVASAAAGALSSWRGHAQRPAVPRLGTAGLAALAGAAMVFHRVVMAILTHPRASIVAGLAFALAGVSDFATPKAAAGLAVLLFGWTSIAVPEGSTRFAAVLAKLRELARIPRR